MKLKQGYTLMHEHITIDLSKVKNDDDACLDCYDQTLAELKELKQSGVGNILDVTNIGMGRDFDYVKRAGGQSGINILSSTGYYKEPFLPVEVYDKTVEELAEQMLAEIASKQVVCIGEIGTSKDKMTDMENKVFLASVEAAAQSGTLIYTHTTLGTYALEQADFFISHGIDPRRVIIGHIDLSQNLDYIREVLKKGVYVGFDTVGKNNYFPDENRARFLAALQEEEKLDRVVLSLDITRKSHLRAFGGIGYNYLFQTFLPLLRAKGISEESIDQMLIENPKQLLEDK
ncbi:MAG: TatD family hydrolase [Elusimicrobiota bacterium]|jgi:phosphotriesterase-related protein|nr:TatD family hydrolase [Elusimicrobiota bacterium]